MYTKQRLGEGTGEQSPEEIYTPLACLVPLQAIKDWPLTSSTTDPDTSDVPPKSTPLNRTGAPQSRGGVQRLRASPPRPHNNLKMDRIFPLFLLVLLAECAVAKARRC